ncbi:hypothetical protein ACQ4PT_058897 [Festuca glaucescens]
MASESTPFCVSGAGGPKGGAAAKPHGHVVLPGRVHDALIFAAGAAAAVLLLLGTASFLSPTPVPNLVALRSPAVSVSVSSAASHGLAPGRTFYDDPDLSYAVGRRHLTGWDAKRAQWLRLHYPRGLNASGGARRHGVRVAIPNVRATMLAHPEAEWIWWLDADAVLTDMDFSLPLHRYKDHNLILYGWDREVYDARSWLGLNAGVFLIRNCQWSLDFMDAWARMGPASPEYADWGKLIGEALNIKADNGSDDQAALVYLLLKNRNKWGAKTYLHNDYYFQGYWAEIVDQLDDIAARYLAAERRAPGAAALRRRHSEGEHARYAAARNAAAKRSVPGPAGGGQTGWRRPFVTHFTGCQPCGGKPNEIYSKETCADGMRRALTFADDQVLRAYGFRQSGPLSDDVRPLPFGYPAARQ